MKVSTHWLKDFVKTRQSIQQMANSLTMAGLEVKKMESAGDDLIFDLEITTNRPDWLSHYGVARELAAVLGLPLKALDLQKRAPASASPWKIELDHSEACPYYTGILLQNVQHAPTPDWMQKRLLACGVRSIDLFVDITNYVLLETGQPLHAFDADLLAGQKIRVRSAKKGETFEAIDGSLLKLDPEDLMIADDHQSVALAGVMGGKQSEVNPGTKNVFLESAFFHPRWVRRSSRRHNLVSESSYRFERRVDPEGVDIGRERAPNYLSVR